MIGGGEIAEQKITRAEICACLFACVCVCLFVFTYRFGVFCCSAKILCLQDDERRENTSNDIFVYCFFKFQFQYALSSVAMTNLVLNSC